MGTSNGFTKKDAAVVVGCVLFLLINLGAIGNNGRRRARAAVCLSKLRQWGAFMLAYTEQNDGYLGRNRFLMWTWRYINRTGQDYQHPQDEGEFYDDKGLLLCPAASKVTREMGEPYGYVDADAWYVNRAWGYYWKESYHMKNSRGSYGMSNWIQNAAPGTEPYPGCKARDHWKQLNNRGAEKIPMVGDAWYPASFPRNTDNAPYLREGIANRGGGSHIRIFVVDRHNECTNMVFMDLGARKVGLKELWRMKWSRDSKTDRSPPWWPEWMRNMKDY